MREEIIKVLQKDSVMKKIIANAKKEVVVKESNDDCFQSLYETIIYQQLSGKAASSILRKFLSLFPEGKVTPKAVLEKSEEELASAGISRQKRGYLYSLAEKFLDGTITPEKFGSMKDEEIITELVQIKGIGPWSAQMYLMFTLGREDVFAPDDLGLRKAIQVNYQLAELPKPKEAEKWLNNGSLIERMPHYFYGKALKVKPLDKYNFDLFFGKRIKIRYKMVYENE